MFYQDSFEYVFYDLLRIIKPAKIEYQHKALLCVYEDGITPNGASQWCLSIQSFSDYDSLEDFKKGLIKAIDSIISEITISRIELSAFFDDFIDELQNKKVSFRKLLEKPESLKVLPDTDIIALQYKGYLPIEDHHEFHILGISGKPQKTDHDENDYKELFRLARFYMQIIDRELNRVILFLKHQKNITLLQNQRLSNPKGKEEYFDLIRFGKIEEVFKKLSCDNVYKNSEQIILLSMMYHMLEKDKISDTIKRDDYNVQLAKVASSIITVIMDE